MRTRRLYDLVALLARVGVGIVILAHGWQKIQVGVTATSARFQDMGVPAATAAAIYATFAELLGGVALILGLALPVAGILVFLDMAGAFAFVHAGKGVFLIDGGAARNGFELVLVLGVASLLFAAGGGGRLTLDRRLFPPRRERTAAPDSAVAMPADGNAFAAGRAATGRQGTADRDPAIGADPSPAPSRRAAPALTGEATPAEDPSPPPDRRGRSRTTSATAATGPGSATPPGENARASRDSEESEDAAEPPRPVPGIGDGTAGDVLVAGRAKRRGGRKAGRDTSPAAQGDPAGEG